MPEMNVAVRWPDGRIQNCYSPSLVMHDHLEVGGRYTVSDFTSRAGTALAEAAERVRAKYGFACTSAMASADEINSTARQYADNDVVEVISMHPPLPA
ncbi:MULTISPECIES: MSMEG_0570 family nitrogen starvation response protein [unclassified Gordonia (in: high G+C Gram-positive bacteria)]